MTLAMMAFFSGFVFNEILTSISRRKLAGAGAGLSLLVSFRQTCLETSYCPVKLAVIVQNCAWYRWGLIGGRLFTG